MRFQDKPRDLPPNKHAQQYWSRKQCYTINAQVVGNDEYIYDIDIGWPGSTHDSRIWTRSQVKPYIEQQRRFYCAGDSGYPISEVLIKPYSTAEAANSRRKRIFNSRLSGLRTRMSENLYGVWKKRFPILRALRSGVVFSQKIIIATAVLFNFGRMLKDEPPEDEDDDYEEDDTDESEFVIIDEDVRTVRIRGQTERDRICANMQ